MTWSGVLCFLGLLQLCNLPADANVQHGSGLPRSLQKELSQKKKKRKKGKLERLFTLSPASPRSSDSLRVSLGCHGYPEDSKPRRNCLHWMTAAEARAAWTEVFSERDRIDPELPGEKGAQKSTSPSFKCHAPGSDCQPWPMLFLRTAFRNVASLNVAWRSQV